MSDRPVALFDFDGTLVDSSRGIVSCLQQVLPKYGVEKTDAELVADIGPAFHVTWAQYGMDEAAIHACLAEYRALYTAGPMYDVTVYDGIAEMLPRLADAGVTMAVATAKGEPYARQVIDHLGWLPMFATVSGAALDGSRIHKGEIIAEAIERLTCESAVMFGDRDVDLIGAAKCEVPAVGVLWGFGDRAELESAGAMAVIETPVEVDRFLL